MIQDKKMTLDFQAEVRRFHSHFQCSDVRNLETDTSWRLGQREASLSWITSHLGGMTSVVTPRRLRTHSRDAAGGQINLQPHNLEDQLRFYECGSVRRFDWYVGWSKLQTGSFEMWMKYVHYALFQMTGIFRASYLQGMSRHSVN